MAIANSDGDAQKLGSVTELSEAQVDYGGGHVGEAHPTAARLRGGGRSWLRP